MPSGGTSLHNSALIEAYIREALRRHRSVHGCVVAGQMRIKKRKPSRAGVDLLNMMAHEISAQHTSLLVGWAGGRYSGRESCLNKYSFGPIVETSRVRTSTAGGNDKGRRRQPRHPGQEAGRSRAEHSARSAKAFRSCWMAAVIL